MSLKILFILVIEFYATKIRESKSIKGILDYTTPDFQVEIRILQYADDNTLFLQTLPCVTESLEITEDFNKFSGLDLNRIKSLCLPIGNAPVPTTFDLGITWLGKNDQMKILGTYYQAQEQASKLEDNWITKTESIQNIINKWQKRQISMWGKE